MPQYLFGMATMLTLVYLARRLAPDWEIAVGEKLKVPVAKETMYLFELADRMLVFLRKRVEITDWNSTEAARQYTEPINITFFKEVFNDWFKVTGKDFLAEALRVRRRA